MTLDECKREPDHNYVVEDDGCSIRFIPCGVKSWHPDDIRNVYCGRCHLFIDDVIREERQRQE